MRRILSVVVAVGCGSKSPPPAAKPPDPVTAPEPTDPPISLVTSFVVVDACPESRRLDSKLATLEIDELVSPCKKVPGGAAHFSATLLPGGRVELASPSGDTAEGIVPTCLLQSAGQLKHKMKLKKSCKFDVKLEQRLAEKQTHEE